MQRNDYSRIPARRTKRFDLTRRGLLGAAAVITGAGIADLLHGSGRGNAARVSSNSVPRLQTHVVTRGEQRAVPHNGSTPASTPTSSHSTPSTQHSSSNPPSGHARSGAHGKVGPHNQAHVAEHVDLPPAKLRVRTRPIFYIDDLIPDAPKHAIALTVDDGPDPEYTPKVLRILDKYRMQASFCIVGAHAEAYPSLIRDIHRAGHVIVNHTFTHVQPFNLQTEKRIVGEITRTQRTLEHVAKVTPQLFRAPGGAWSPFIFRAVAAYDLIPLDWDVDPRDWTMPGTRAIQRAMLRGRPNDIVLCHDGGGDRIETVRALRKVLPEWKHRGYQTIRLIVPKQELKAPASPPPSAPPQSPSPTGSPTGQASNTPSP